MNSVFNFFEQKRTDGGFLRGSLHIADGSKSKPMFLFCHGITSHRIGPSYLFVKLSRYLASNGFSSARFDFFGSGESDGEFHEMTLQTMIDDVRDMTTYLQNRFSPEKFIVAGHSLGGMVAALSTEQSGADGLILIAPVGSCEKLIERKDGMLKNGLTKNGFIEFGAHELSHNAFESVRDVNPAENISQKFIGRLLVIHGSDDVSVSEDESLSYIKAAQHSSINSAYHVINGADHNFSHISDVQALCTIISSWTKEQF